MGKSKWVMNKNNQHRIVPLDKSTKFKLNGWVLHVDFSWVTHHKDGWIHHERLPALVFSNAINFYVNGKLVKEKDIKPF